MKPCTKPALYSYYSSHRPTERFSLSMRVLPFLGMSCEVICDTGLLNDTLLSNFSI